MSEQLDHLAIGVADLDAQIELFTRAFGMRTLRLGTRFGSGERIALLHQPGSSFKLELIESGEPNVLLHLAQRTDDLADATARLLRSGLRQLRDAHRLEAARAETSLFEDRSGLKVQLIRYDPDSPDMPEGAR
jgi:catechol 2,3-dioxygenase-like lactoylglutathione lyase family enzyme